MYSPRLSSAGGEGSYDRFGLVDNGERRDGAIDQIANSWQLGDGCLFTPWPGCPTPSRA
jgi:hypothetical protein